MKKTVLFGAGQYGMMISRLAGPEFDVICFADNSPQKQGTELLGIPVVSPEESMKLGPEAVCLCVADELRAKELKEKLRELGFEGEILSPESLKFFDARFAAMRLLAEQLEKEKIPGEAAELGVFRGAFAAAINGAFPKRTICLFDTFEGFAEADVKAEKENSYSKAQRGDFSQTGVEEVLKRLPHPERAELHKGWFPESFDASCREKLFAFVSLDADLYAPTKAALPLFYDRLSPGGAIMVHDVNSLQYRGAGAAVEEFCRERKLLPVPVPDLHGSVIIRKGL